MKRYPATFAAFTGRLGHLPHSRTGRLAMVLLAVACGLIFYMQAEAQQEQAAERPVEAVQAAQTARTLTIASYNVQNFFDVFDDPYTADEKTPVKPREAIEKLARVVRLMDADIVAFQEVENEHVLKAMIAQLLADMGYRHVAVGQSNDGRGIAVGVISRFPIDSVTSYRFRQLTLPADDRTWTFARNLVKVRIAISDEQSLDVLAVHLKSKWDTPDDPKSSKWRLAEAMEIRRVVNQLHHADNDAFYVVLGDFNDTPQSQTIRTLLEPAADAKPILLDVHATLPMKQRITYLGERYRNAGPIDYIFASPALSQRTIPDSARILSDEKHPALKQASDHAPLLVSFEID